MVEIFGNVRKGAVYKLTLKRILTGFQQVAHFLNTETENEAIMTLTLSSMHPGLFVNEEPIAYCRLI